MTDNRDCDGGDHVPACGLHMSNTHQEMGEMLLEYCVAYGGVFTTAIRQKTNINKSKVIIQNG
jgi:hypothetical protein